MAPLAHAAKDQDVGNKGDVTPETAAAVGFAIASAVLEYARANRPEMVEMLVEAQIKHARRLIDLDQGDQT